MDKIEQNDFDHYMGIELNIQTWNLLEKTDRNENDGRRMLFFAKASLYHWQKSPHFKPVNEQRGEWLISRVYAVLNQGEKSLEHANTCMDLTLDESLKDFDLAYAYECKARAFATLGDSKKMNDYFVKAKDFGDQIQSEKDRRIFFNDLHTEPWYECLG